MKYLLLSILLVGCSNLGFKPTQSQRAESRQFCVETFYKLGMKAEDAVKACQFVEER